MTTKSLFTAAALMAAAACSAQTYVDHNTVKCEAAAAPKRPQMELQTKLKGEGWKVRQVKDFNGCYEVYAFDPKGNRIEAFFDPRSFVMVGQVKPE